MTPNTAMMARRKTLFSRTLVLTALFVVAAAGSVFCVRSARADVPVAAPKENVSAKAQAVASALAAQSVGNPAVGASLMQVLWGGGVKENPPKGSVTPPPTEKLVSQTLQRVRPSRTLPSVRKTASAN